MTDCPNCGKQFPDTMQGTCDMVDHYVAEHCTEREQEAYINATPGRKEH